ncbi:hypothetical protein EL45_07630 [Cellulophaga sp. E6(2014)]|nr:hypothetical protein EL45_07630 [Cellulophaga sp. E6(2014)]
MRALSRKSEVDHGEVFHISAAVSFVRLFALKPTLFPKIEFNDGKPKASTILRQKKKIPALLLLLL